jgi:lactate dehydrogenase-like 2-hydroxyacid dehydrogenase
LPNLGAITCFGVGVDAVDLAATADCAVQVSNTPDVLNECVADQALGLLLAVSRRIIEADRFVRAGRWESERFGLSTALGGKRCGILGIGPIGQAIARRAAAFGMPVAYCARSPKAGLNYPYYDSALGLAEQSDVLILALPGGGSTSGIVDAQVLEALGPQGILINVARGSVVDESALIEALQGKRLLGAGLDVFANEPHVSQALRDLDNVVLAPHIASGTVETRTAMAARVLENLEAFFRSGQVLHPVQAGAR